MGNRSYPRWQEFTMQGRRPILVDFFSKAGGAAMGYYLSGWDVICVDIEPQPHNPFPFFEADAFEFIKHLPAMVRALHASPPCLKFTAFQMSQPQRENKHLDLITPFRPLLEATGLPWVIENVPGAPLRNPVTMCGTAFGLGVPRGELQRHRLFEANWPIVGTKCNHKRPCVMVAGHGKDGYRGSGLTAAEARQAMQIDWMNRNEMAQAIPPAYTMAIGSQLLPRITEKTDCA